MNLFQPLLDMAGLRLNYRDKATYHAFFNGLVPIIAMVNVFLNKLYVDQLSLLFGKENIKTYLLYIMYFASGYYLL